MALAAGTRLGPYEVLAPIGAGGMGEVYRARDTRLGRDVAVKILPIAFARDPERLRRFEQEARAVAALNHPNILAIHDIGTQTDGSPYLVSELLEGESLRQRLQSGALPARKAIEYGIQIADGLSVAHEKGVVHRDLKPENLFITKDSRVKILDFGLAKLTQAETTAAGKTVTGSAGATQPGTVMGTIGYMSPEQVRAMPTDHRSDIFSFGPILYEMLSGRRAFERASSVETMHAILKEEPPEIAADGRQMPPGIERILRHCLEKEPEYRFQSARDLSFALSALSDRSSAAHSGIASSPTSRPVRLLRRLALPLVGLLIAAACLTAGLMLVRRTPRGVAWRVLPLTAYSGLESQPALSPDGNQVAFIWDGGVPGRSNLYVRLIDGGVPLLLAGDDSPKSAPTWSPDARRIAFIRGSGVYLIPSLGGTERKLAQLDRISISGFITNSRPQLSWSPDGRFIAVGGAAKAGEALGVFLISTESGELMRLSSLPAGFNTDIYPAFSPDGTRVAFARFRSNFNAAIFAVFLSRDGTAKGEPQRLTPDDWHIAGLDWLDNSNLVLSGRTGARYPLWKLPASGGAPEALPYESESATGPTVARNGNRLAFEKSESDSNIWLLPGPASGLPLALPGKRLIASTRFDGEMKFSLDGKKIVFTSEQSGTNDLWVADADGSNQVQITTFPGMRVGSPRWSPDGTRIVFDAYANGNSDIYVVGAEGGKIRPLTAEPSNDIRPSWSPDGKWIYFGSNRSGRYEVWKAPAGGGSAVQVTHDAGFECYSSPDGRFLFYTKRDVLGLWKRPAEGGREERILDDMRQGDWGIAGDDIYFLARASAKTAATISMLHLSTGKREELYRFPTETPPFASGSPFAVSSDARSFLISLLDRNDRDLMLVENFR
ncbi:MAG: protein kinase domain-containing protein [Acidobacteriota bacterium]